MLKRKSIRYRLLRDLPTLKAGSIFEYMENENFYICTEKDSDMMTVYDERIIKKREWFEPIEDWELMEGGGNA